MGENAWKWILHPTICPYCGCGCGLNLVSVDGKVKGVEPWKRSPVNEGKLCPKGNFAHEFIHHPDRLTTPLIREKNGFREASWEEALNLIAFKLMETNNEDPDLIGFLGSARCTNEENYILQKFARAVIGTNNIDNCADLCHGPSVAGLGLTFGSGAMTNSIDDLEDSKCIFVIGSNTLEQHPLIGRRILKARDKGSKIILADPRNTVLAPFSDLILTLKPGTDIALLNAMMNVILANGLEDTDFIKNRTQNFEKLEETIKDYTPEYAEQITGIPSHLIEKAALLYGEAECSSIIYSMGITQHLQGTDNVKSIANLAMLTGNIGKQGSGVNPLRGQNNVQGACDMGVLPYLYPGYQKVVIDENRGKIENCWHCPGLNYLPGLQLVEMMEAAHDGDVKAVYIMGENPMVSDPNLGHIGKSLNNLDFLVVQDIFMTETAQLAHVVLPAASWAEKEGTFTNTERRVQLIRKAVDSPGNAEEDWAIICNLAHRMGSELFEFTSVEEIFNELREITPQYHGITYKRLQKPEGIQWPCFDEDHPGTSILHRDRFPTSNGKGVFIPVTMNPSQKIANSEYPFTLTTGRVIFHYQTGTMTLRSKTLKNQLSESYVEINQEDASDLQIKNGETVRISTSSGEILIKAKITEDIMRNVIFIPFHFSGPGGVNILTNGESLDPVSKMPALKVSAARIDKVDDYHDISK